MHKLVKMVDVKSKLCAAEDCTVQPSFGYPHHKPTFCGEHKLPKMINVVAAKRSGAKSS